MPELPEVETIVSGLSASIKGQRVLGVFVQRADILANTDLEHLNKHLSGQVLEEIYRRGKYIVMGFHNRCSLITHLRMSGSYRLLSGHQVIPYLRLWFELEDGRRLGYLDKRALGRIWLYPPGESLSVLTRLGPEPLSADFTLKQFRRLLGQHRRQIKPLLLDQTFVAGIGNIYASEILYQAGIAPTRYASGLTPGQVSSLYRAVRQVLKRAITHKGTHISDFAGPEGDEGEFVTLLEVYQRAGSACRRCGGIIQRLVQQQRSTYWCPGCQH